jgi:hypothetical protein
MTQAHRFTGVRMGVVRVIVAVRVDVRQLIMEMPMRMTSSKHEGYGREENHHCRYLK